MELLGCVKSRPRTYAPLIDGSADRVNVKAVLLALVIVSAKAPLIAIFGRHIAVIDIPEGIQVGGNAGRYWVVASADLTHGFHASAISIGVHHRRRHCERLIGHRVRRVALYPVVEILGFNGSRARRCNAGAKHIDGSKPEKLVLYGWSSHGCTDFVALEFRNVSPVNKVCLG